MGLGNPLASVIVAVLVLRSGYYVSKASLHVLMEGTPQNVNVDDVVKIIEQTKEIKGLHDLHIWSITSGLNALSCHGVVDDQMTIGESEKLLRKIEHDLLHLNIQHVTIQLETEAHQHNNSILCTAKADAPDAHAHHHH